jgi:medium-chain acyl-[acyl-carrier-protein] hydrolase
MNNNLNNIYQETKTIRAYDVDFNNKIKISSVFNLLQDVASVHADLLGLGFQDLNKLDLGWVLSWVKLNIERYPSFGDSITIKTWPRCKFKLYSMRDYSMQDTGGKILLNATSAWLPINTKSKRIIDTKNLPRVINYQPDLIAVEEFPDKIITGATQEILLHKKFKYTDIDINQHVNNTRYIEMILDCYPADHYAVNQIKSFEISFSSESFFDDEIEITRSSEERFDIIQGTNTKTLKQVFISRLEWKPNQV